MGGLEQLSRVSPFPRIQSETVSLRACHRDTPLGIANVGYRRTNIAPNFALLAAYFTAFTQQMVPTDQLGNPENTSHPVSVSDDGSLAG